MSRRERRILRRKGKKYKPEQPAEQTSQKTQQKETEHQVRRKKNKLLNFYEKNYKKNMWITIILLLLSIGIIIGNQVITGDFIYRGISLKGGVTVTVPYDKPIDVKTLQGQLLHELGGSINARALKQAGRQIGIIVDATDVDPDDLVKAIKGQLGDIPKISVETMGSSLGQSFFKQTIIAIIIAFGLMGLVVFFAFRTFVPGAAVILSAFSDMIMTIAALDLFRIKLETAGIAALLMLIGYSVDTDILLTTRVLKREIGSVFDRCISAMKTGLTMTLTSFAAVFAGYFFTQSETLKQIMLILLIGLTFDVLNTWIQNVGIIRWYMEKKSKKHAKETLEEFHGRDKEEAENKRVEKKESGKKEPEKEEKEPDTNKEQTNHHNNHDHHEHYEQKEKHQEHHIVHHKHQESLNEEEKTE